MKTTLAFAIIFALVIAYNWRQKDHSIVITLPSDGQLKEMIGISNTPSVPLTPIQH